MNSIAHHRSVLLRLLSDIFRHPVLASQLAFKGGTCLYLLHALPRFSTDLDFTLLEANAFDAAAMSEIVEQSLRVRDHREKHYTWFWRGSYGNEQGWAVKIEVSKREHADLSEVRNLYGLSVRCLTAECMLAHKLCAVTGRKNLANRDLFDCHFLLKRGTSIYEPIIRDCAGKGVEEYLAELVTYIPRHIGARGVLDGLGELLEPGLKEWAREHLLEELLFYLRSYADGSHRKTVG
jgi:hypothetical protein